MTARQRFYRHVPGLGNVAIYRHASEARARRSYLGIVPKVFGVQ